jgi:hypothetical protein
MNKTAPGFLNCYELEEWLSLLEDAAYDDDDDDDDDDDEFVQSRFYGD